MCRGREVRYGDEMWVAPRTASPSRRRWRPAGYGRVMERTVRKVYGKRDWSRRFVVLIVARVALQATPAAPLIE